MGIAATDLARVALARHIAVTVAGLLARGAVRVAAEAL